MKNRKNNKGFSLVELIVVVAIMAVLVGVLAPAYLKYVENSRITKDESALEEVRHAVEIAVADEDIYDDVTFDADDTKCSTVTITVGDDGAAAVASGVDSLQTEVQSLVGATIQLNSKQYSVKDTVYTVYLNGQTDISASWQ